jgi:hypothetical protein
VGREIIHVVDGDAHPQARAATLGLATFWSNPEPVRAHLAYGAFRRHLLEAQHRVEGERPIDVGDCKPESGYSLDHSKNLTDTSRAFAPTATGRDTVRADPGVEVAVSGFTLTFAGFSSTTPAYGLVPGAAIPILLVAIAPRFFKPSPRFVSGP